MSAERRDRAFTDIQRRIGGRWWSLCILVLVLALCLSARLLNTPGLRSVQAFGHDQFQGIAPAAGPSEVAVIRIGPRSIGDHGPWPWPRDRLADLVTDVSALDPRVIVMTIFLDGPDRFGRGDAQPPMIRQGGGGTAAAAPLTPSDRRLAAGLARTPSVLATYATDLKGQPPDKPLARLDVSGVIRHGAASVDGMMTPLAGLRNAARTEGAANLFPIRT